ATPKPLHPNAEKLKALGLSHSTTQPTSTPGTLTVPLKKKGGKTEYATVHGDVYDGGLAVHPSPDGKTWTVTHTASGLAAKGGIATKEEAHLIAEGLLATGANFHGDAASVFADPKVKAKAKAIIDAADDGDLAPPAGTGTAATGASLPAGKVVKYAGDYTVVHGEDGKYHVVNQHGTVVKSYAGAGAATTYLKKIGAMDAAPPKPTNTGASSGTPVPTATTVAPTDNYQHTFTQAPSGPTTPLATAQKGDTVAVPYLAKLTNGVSTSGQGRLVQKKGNVAIVEANGLFHAVNAETGAPFSVHHQTEQGALQAAIGKQVQAAPAKTATATLPTPTSQTVNVGLTSGSVKDTPVQAEVYGPLAVHLDTHGSGWSISHVASGYQVGKHFTTKEAALSAVEAGLKSIGAHAETTDVATVKGSALTSVVNAVKHATSPSSSSPTALNPLAVPTGTVVPVNSVFDGVKRLAKWGFDLGSNLQTNLTADKAFVRPYKQFMEATHGAKQWWTAAEHKALAMYQGNSWYGPLNASLWGGSSATADPALRTLTKGLDTIMAKSGSPFDLTVTKAKEKGSGLWHQMAEIQVGGEWSPLGFDSTKIASPQNDWGGGGVRVHYQVPGGVLGTGVHYKSLPGNQYPEAEFLLSRNTKWKVASKTVGPDGKIEVVMAFDGFRGVTPGEWGQNYPLANP
ncbi:MAG: hypothetical protein WCG26_10455, partial [Chloroflexales bacterium]